MKLFLSAALALGVAAPVFAQDVVIEFKPEVFTCADYSKLDDAGKAVILPELRKADEVASNTTLMAQDDAQLTTTVTAACAQYPDMVLVQALTMK